MKQKPVVFSLIREQSTFMTAIMSVLTFLSVLTLGIALMIGTGAVRTNTNWDLYATIQTTDSNDAPKIREILEKNKKIITSSDEISDSEMMHLMSPWVSGGSALQKYLPKMWEVKFSSAADLKSVQAQITPYAKFLTHTSALSKPIRAGWYLIAICALVLMVALTSITVCVTYIAYNTAMLHKRELEILNQIGASDSFVARQMQVIVARICTRATIFGFLFALPFLFLIIAAAHSAGVGMFAMIGLNTFGWVLLFLMPIFITIFATYITKHTTKRILKNS
jgi:cell division protein FtsX